MSLTVLNKYSIPMLAYKADHHMAKIKLVMNKHTCLKSRYKYLGNLCNTILQTLSITTLSVINSAKIRGNIVM